jgi:hypothetical protein
VEVSPPSVSQTLDGLSLGKSSQYAFVVASNFNIPHASGASPLLPSMTETEHELSIYLDSLGGRTTADIEGGKIKMVKSHNLYREGTTFEYIQLPSKREVHLHCMTLPNNLKAYYRYPKNGYPQES